MLLTNIIILYNIFVLLLVTLHLPVDTFSSPWVAVKVAREMHRASARDALFTIFVNPCMPVAIAYKIHGSGLLYTCTGIRIFRACAELIVRYNTKNYPQVYKHSYNNNLQHYTLTIIHHYIYITIYGHASLQKLWDKKGLKRLLSMLVELSLYLVHQPAKNIEFGVRMGTKLHRGKRASIEISKAETQLEMWNVVTNVLCYAVFCSHTSSSAHLEKRHNTLCDCCIPYTTAVTTTNVTLES